MTGERPDRSAAIRDHKTVTQASSERSRRFTPSRTSPGDDGPVQSAVSTAAVRNDGFSTFGQANPRAWYPKASAARTFTNALGNSAQTGILSFGSPRFVRRDRARAGRLFRRTRRSGAAASAAATATSRRRPRSGSAGCSAPARAAILLLSPSGKRKSRPASISDSSISGLTPASRTTVLPFHRRGSECAAAAHVRLQRASSSMEQRCAARVGKRPFTRRPITTRASDVGSRSSVGAEPNDCRRSPGCPVRRRGRRQLAEASPQAVAGGSFVYRGLGFARCGMSQRLRCATTRMRAITDFDGAVRREGDGYAVRRRVGLPGERSEHPPGSRPESGGDGGGGGGGGVGVGVRWLKWTGGLHTGMTFGTLAGLGPRRS